MYLYITAHTLLNDYLSYLVELVSQNQQLQRNQSSVWPSVLLW